MVAERVEGKGRTGVRAGILTFALAVGASFAVMPAMAQDKKPDESQSAWVKLCQEAPDIKDAAKKTKVCMTHHEALNSTNGQIIVSAAIRETEGDDKKSLVIAVPVGVVLPAGLKFKVDENDPIDLTFRFCLPHGCTAETEATAALIDQLTKGKQAAVGALSITGKVINLPVPLNGFGKAYAGAPIDNAKYAQAYKDLIVKIRENQIELAKKAKADADQKKK